MKLEKLIELFGVENWRVRTVIDLGIFKWCEVNYIGLGFWKGLMVFMFPFIIYEIK